jgi:hypothetical protein
MKKKFLSGAAVVLFGVVSVVSGKPATAADAPAKAPAAAPAKTPAVAPAPAPAIPKKLSAQDMSTQLKLIGDYEMMLQKAGYTVLSGKTRNGQPGLRVTWKNGSISYVVNITLNNIDGENYFSAFAPLSNIPDLNKIPVLVFVRLLQAQDAMQGWYFVLSEQEKRFYMARLMPATGMTTSLLLNELKTFEANVHPTERFWNPAAWVAPAPATAPPAAPAAPPAAPAQPTQ